MTKIERIMFPTDFSEASGAAIPWVAKIAGLTSAQVFLVHVLPEADIQPDPQYHYRIPEYQRDRHTDAKRRLHELAACLPGDLTILKLLFFGDVIEQILRGVHDYEIDLIIMATRGETGWRNLLFGSVAEAIIKSADCPVLSIRRSNGAVGLTPAEGTPPTAA